MQLEDCKVDIDEGIGTFETSMEDLDEAFPVLKERLSPSSAAYLSREELRKALSEALCTHQSHLMLEIERSMSSHTELLRQVLEVVSERPSLQTSGSCPRDAGPNLKSTSSMPPVVKDRNEKFVQEPRLNIVLPDKYADEDFPDQRDARANGSAKSMESFTQSTVTEAFASTTHTSEESKGINSVALTQASEDSQEKTVAGKLLNAVKTRVTVMNDNILRTHQGPSKDDFIKQRELEADLAKKTSAMNAHHVSQSLCAIPAFAQLVHNPGFEAATFVLIMSNVVLVGIEVDTLANQAMTAEMGDAFLWTSYVYTALFTLELCIRFLADGCKFFWSENWAWNWFDLFIVLTSIADMFTSLVFSSKAADMSHMRAFRTFRMTRLLRVVRIIRLVRFIRALRTLIYSILVTLRSVIWTLLLLLFMCYGFGVAFTQAVSDHIFTDAAGERAECSERVFAVTSSPGCLLVSLKIYWGTLPRAMLTLFKVLCGGVDWEDVSLPLSEVSWIAVASFIAYVFLAAFAFLNVVTGVFCQSAIEGAQQDKDIAATQMMANRVVYTKALKDLFENIDEDHDGAMTWEEFKTYLQHEQFRAYLEALNIDTNDVWSLFKLLDRQETGSIEIEDFVDGCLMLKGYAKAIHIAKLSHNTNALHMQFEAFMDYVEEELNTLTDWAGCSRGERHSKRLKAARFSRM